MAKVFGCVCGLLTIFLLTTTILTAAYGIDENDFYDINSNLPYIASKQITLVKLREKRDAVATDPKHEYDVSSSSALSTSKNQDQPQPSQQTNTQNVNINDNGGNGGSSTERTLANASIMVPYNVHNVGVNGTGQRKDISQLMPTSANAAGTGETTTKSPITNIDITNMNPSIDGEAVNKKNTTQYPKKVVTLQQTPITGTTQEPPTMQQQSSHELTDVERKVIDKIDVPQEDTENDIHKQNLTINETTDHHIYYNSSTIVDKTEADRIWVTMKNITHNSMLSQSHRRAMTVELTFNFPFYGHFVRNITVATGGFLYTGEYVHSWLAATQYIAPLMANFDTSISNDSFVRLNDNGTAFTVVWENVVLQDKPALGKFTFSTTLHKNGDIVFTYFNIPIMINSIQDNQHPVKVGLSDAYIIDKVVYFARRKTIYEYHRVTFSHNDIVNSTVIYLTALKTCLSYTDCDACIHHDTNFECVWCPSLNRCSTGTDRKKQEWLQKGCDRGQITDVSHCPAIGNKGNNAAMGGGSDSGSGNSTTSQNGDSTQSSSSSSSSATNQHNGQTPDTSQSVRPTNTDKTVITPSNESMPNKDTSILALDAHNEPKSMGVAFGFLVPICFIAAIMLWVLYAYRNPHTKSGQLLIQYRPSQWGWRRGEARYTAATIHM